MILVTGGKYQGKHKCALKLGGYSIDDVFDFGYINSAQYINSGMDYRKQKIWYNLDTYVRALVYQGTEMPQIINMISRLVDSYTPDIVIISEVGAGVIPIDEKENTFRETTGKVSVMLAEKSEEVYRVVCGLKMKLK